jgi:hypothetical protein
MKTTISRNDSGANPAACSPRLATSPFRHPACFFATCYADDAFVACCFEDFGNAGAAWQYIDVIAFAAV